MRMLVAALTIALMPLSSSPDPDLGRRLDQWIRPLVVDRSDEDVYWYPAMYARVEVQLDSGGAVTRLLRRTLHGQSIEIPRSDDRR